MTTVVVIIIVVTTVIILVLPLLLLLLRIVLLLLLLFVFLFLVSATGSKASVRLFRTAGARKGTITTRKHTFIIFIFIIIIIIITITIIIDIITTITTTITILTLIINRPSKQPCPQAGGDSTAPVRGTLPCSCVGQMAARAEAPKPQTVHLNLGYPRL